MPMHPPLGTNRPRRYRMRPEDEARLHAIQVALNARTEADALRSALLIAYTATVKTGPAIGAAKEPVQVPGAVPEGQPAPAPRGTCPLCGVEVPVSWLGKTHKVKGVMCKGVRE